MQKKSSFIFFAILILAIGCKETKTENQPKTEDQKYTEDYISAGKEIASTSFISLSSALTKAKEKGGLKNALAYCNEKALPLTDSLSKVYQVDIKRTSLKYRNPNNKPSKKEEQILNQYKLAKDNGQILQAIIDNEGGVNTFYAPIIIQDACLKCHGQKSEITIIKTIEDLYPNDLATDYSRGDLRGMWCISFRN